jgi:DegV family protein with EDD domain
MIRIVTDSTCDLPQEFICQYAIQVVPIHIMFGAECYLDGVTIDSDAFYRRVTALGQLPQTSQPSPSDFVSVYQSLAAQADTILSIHLTSKLSGTYQSAVLAAGMVTNRVHVFDSLAGSAGLGFMCLEAARMSEAGKTLEEIVRRLETIRARMNIFFTVADLKFAQMSGRVGRLQSTLAALLNVKPIIGLQEGTLNMVERVRSHKQSLERMIELMYEQVGQNQVNLAVIHAQAPAEAQALLERVRRKFSCAESFAQALALGIAVHMGPGTLGIVAYQV